MTTEPEAEVELERLELDARVDAIIEPWEAPTGTRNSKAETHARVIVNTARTAVCEMLLRHDQEMREAVDRAVEELRAELEGRIAELTDANIGLLGDVELKSALLDRLGMASQVISELAVKLNLSAAQAVVSSGGGSMGAGAESFGIGPLVGVYSAGAEPSVEFGDPGLDSWVRYHVGKDGLTPDQLDAVGILFGSRSTPKEATEVPPAEAA